MTEESRASGIFYTLTPNGWGMVHCEKQKFEVNSTFKAVTAGFYGTDIFPIVGIRRRHRYLPYLVFDQQKVRYYGVFDEICPISDTELRFYR
ncbi:MAG: hypothetical protein U9Q37_07240 [Euryarchaeota archaeon]|nr:hypothetical protein [Euryarchaeota archaeon]